MPEISYEDGLAKPDPGVKTALKAIHPDLELIRVRSDIAPEVLPPGAVPGCWHIRKGELFLAPITTPNGGYREPDSGILRELAQRDTRRRDVARSVFGRTERELEQRKKAADLYKEQRNYDMAQDLKAGWRVPGRILNAEGKPIKRKVRA